MAMRFLLLFFSLLVFSSCKEGRRSSADNKELIFEKTSHSFGTVPIGLTLHAQFKFKNESNQLVKILKAEKSCTCSEVIVAKNIIAPDESGTVDVNISSGDEQKEFGATIIISARAFDGSEQIYKLEVTGSAVKTLLLKPNHCNFGEINQKQGRKTKTVSIVRGKQNVPWSRISAISHSSSVSATVHQIDRNDYSLDISFDPSVEPIGTFRTDIDVRTHGDDQAGDSVTTLPVIANIIGDVFASPGYIYSFALEKGERSSRKRVKLSSKSRLADIRVKETTVGIIQDVAFDADTNELSFVIVAPMQEGNYYESALVTGRAGKSNFEIRVPVLFAVKDDG